MFVADAAAIKVSPELPCKGHDTNLRRKSSHRVLGSSNQLNNIKPYLFLATTSLPRKVKNGKNIEKY